MLEVGLCIIIVINLKRSRKDAQPTTQYIFYWGRNTNFKGFTAIQVLCTLIVKCSEAPQLFILPPLAGILRQFKMNKIVY